MLTLQYVIDNSKRDDKYPGESIFDINGSTCWFNLNRNTKTFEFHGESAIEFINYTSLNDIITDKEVLDELSFLIRKLKIDKFLIDTTK